MPDEGPLMPAPMVAPAPIHEAMSPEAERFRQFLRWGEPIIPATILLLLVFFRNPYTMAVSAFLGLVFWPAIRWQRRSLLPRNELEKAILASSTCFWGFAIVVGLGGSIPLPVAALSAIIPVVVSIPFATQRLLPWVVGGSTASTAVVAALSLAPRALPWGDVSDWEGQVVVAIYVPILVGLYSLMGWQSMSRVLETLSATREANEALRASERSLERKVEERTAELEHKNEALQTSQREVALARDAAMEANRAKSTFLANMSHELRTPLNAILGYSEMLQEEAQDAGQGDLVPDLQKIHSSGRYLLELINGVLDLSKIESGKMEIYLERFDVAELVRGVEGTIQPLVRKNGNTLEVSGLEGLGSMRSDVTKVRQVLFNLLSNASKFTKEGVIRLDARRESGTSGDRLSFTVSDTGIGMTPVQLARVFEEFTQADTSTTREYGGTGLGLPISKKFCEMLGGTLEASSEAERGSRFGATLPAETAEAPEEKPERTGTNVPASKSGTTRPAAPTTVLVVDDEATARELVARFLTRNGYRVLLASGGEEALALAREHSPDVITLDVIMPEVDGWAVLGRLKSDPRVADIPVILMTIADDQNLGFALGAAEYLTKPIDWNRLELVLRKYRAEEVSPSALVVDDSAVTREMLRRGLEREGWSVVEAENGRVALERVAEHVPQLILLDLMMPEMDGFEVADALRRNEAWRDVPVLVVTSKSLDVDERRRLEGSVARVFQKGSFSREDILSEIRRLTG
jgi:signal transduction histidine kinase/DNA-binding response OmpR family regulator